jgi:hypothetical protein
MLALGGYLNLLIAALHLVGLIWAEDMFRVTGIQKEMEELSLVHASLPYLLTVFVSICFTIFGLYGLSGDGKIRKLPWLKPVLFVIGFIYLIRGLSELIFDYEKQRASEGLETLYSVVAVVIGLLYFVGAARKFRNGSSRI